MGAIDVFTFDDAGPSQFAYIDHNGTLEIDSGADGTSVEVRFPIQ